jgi:hypothetical protein
MKIYPNHKLMAEGLFGVFSKSVLLSEQVVKYLNLNTSKDFYG